MLWVQDKTEPATQRVLSLARLAEYTYFLPEDESVLSPLLSIPISPMPAYEAQLSFLI